MSLEFMVQNIQIINQNENRRSYFKIWKGQINI